MLWGNPGGMQKDARGSFAKEVGQRLARARIAVGLAQKDLAALLKVSPGKLSNWENGWNMVPPQYAVKIFQITKINSDYLYQGDMSGLPQSILKKMMDKTPPSSGNLAS
jgi:transcriptional regulator with XRE-family HTH domain